MADPSLVSALSDTQEAVLLFLASEWDTKKGGISSFNMTLASELANYRDWKCKVYCAVLQATEEQKQHAKRHGVSLLVPFTVHCRDPDLAKLTIPKDVTHIIGHAHITGPASLRLKRMKSFSHVKFWMINHVVPQSVEILKESKSIKSGLIVGKEKTEIITKLNNFADYVWSVGPVMFDSWKNLLDHEKKQKHEEKNINTRIYL